MNRKYIFISSFVGILMMSLMEPGAGSKLAGRVKTNARAIKKRLVRTRRKRELNRHQGS